MGGRSVPAGQGYDVSAPGAVRYVPVTFRGERIGYLWASLRYDAAGYIRRVQHEPPEAFRAPLVWSDRLRSAKSQGLSPLDALRRWRGEPEDPQGGGIAADAEELQAESIEVLDELANPGFVDPLEDFLAQTPTWPDGTPMDRGKSGWGALTPMQVPAGYAPSTSTAVRYLPVTRGGVVLGYLWASVTEDAADFLERAGAGDDGVNAGVPWILRLREAHAEGLTALDALRKWKGAPEDARGGAIAADAKEQQAPSLEALKERASE